MEREMTKSRKKFDAAFKAKIALERRCARMRQFWSWRSGTACTRTRFMPGRSKFSITSRAFSRAAMAVWRAGMDKIEAAANAGQGQARLHLKSKISWSHEWGPVQLPAPSKPISAEFNLLHPNPFNAF
jgi:hypothetical protein